MYTNRQSQERHRARAGGRVREEHRNYFNTIHNALTRATHDKIYKIHVCRVRIVICAICTLLIAIELYRMLMMMRMMTMIYNIKQRHYFGNRFTIQNWMYFIGLPERRSLMHRVEVTHHHLANKYVFYSTKYKFCICYGCGCVCQHRR